MDKDPTQKPRMHYRSRTIVPTLVFGGFCFLNLAHNALFLVDNSNILLGAKRAGHYDSNLLTRPKNNKAVSQIFDKKDSDGPSTGKEYLVQLLLDAGVNVTLEMIEMLPNDDEVMSLYGDEPILYGQEDQCERFQSTVSPENASIATAGMVNSGTNALFEYIKKNCVMPNFNDGVQWQVPWGKHTFASWRHNQTVPSRIDKDNVLPIVIVRDVYSWMTSTCKSPYNIKWPHKSEHCPNLVPNEVDHTIGSFVNKSTVPVRISVEMNGPPFMDKEWRSLVEVWNDWNREYYDVHDYPRIMVRFEDLLFRPKQLTEAICDCAGGKPRHEKFQYNAQPIKTVFSGHKAGNSLLAAIVKYGNPAYRVERYTQQDLDLVESDVDKQLMNTFGYSVHNARLQAS